MNKLFYSAILATGMLALGASAASVADAGIFAVARLYSWGSHSNGDGPEIAHCSITNVDYDAFHFDLTTDFNLQGVNVFMYTEYVATKDFVLFSNNDEKKAVDIFAQECTKHHGTPFRDP